MHKTNLELKHTVNNFTNIRKVLRQLGAKKEGVKAQTDYFFNLPNKKHKKISRLKLRIESGVQTLVYYERPDFKKGKGTDADVCLYTVTDPELLPYLQHALGVRGVVQKRRELWRKAHTVFNLDMVRGVGNIFEIELQKMGKLTEADRKTFKQYQQTLLPFLGGVVRGSNIDLVAKKS